MNTNIFDTDYKNQIREIYFSELIKNSYTIYDLILINYREYRHNTAHNNYLIFTCKSNDNYKQLNIKKDQCFELNVPLIAFQKALKSYVIINGLELNKKDKDMHIKFKRTKERNIDILNITLLNDYEFKDSVEDQNTDSEEGPDDITY